MNYSYWKQNGTHHLVIDNKDEFTSESEAEMIELVKKNIDDPDFVAFLKESVLKGTPLCGFNDPVIGLKSIEIEKEKLERMRFEAACAALTGFCGGEFTGQSGMSHESIAEWSVRQADALIAELNRTAEKGGEG